MRTVTFELPETIAERLESERLPEILELGLQELSPLPTNMYQHILTFLSQNPTADELLDFRPLPEMRQRGQTLLSRAKNDSLTTAEQAELDEYERIAHIMVMFKTNALQPKNQVF